MMKNRLSPTADVAPLKILSLDTFKGTQRVTSHHSGISNSPYPQGRLAIPGLGRIDMIEMTDILYVKAESNYVRIFLKDQGPVVMAKTLKQVSTSLIAFGFLRVHQSFLVHPSLIKTYHSNVGTVVLVNGDVLPVSRPNRKVLSHQLLKVSCI